MNCAHVSDEIMLKIVRGTTKRTDIHGGIDLKTQEGENHLGKILMGLRTKFQMDGIIEEKGFINDFSDFSTGMYLTDEDITQNECECIVNSTDETLLSDEGASGAVFLAAGLELKKECAALGGCAAGDAKLTNGHHLKARYIIHTVGPRYPSSNCRQTLYRCYHNCLSLAKDNGIHSIAFPFISIGKFSYPVNEACEIAMNAVKEWLDRNVEYSMRVIFCSADQKVFDTTLNYLCSITANATKSSSFYEQFSNYLV